MYSLAWETPVCEGRLKAPHALDLPFVFDNTAIADATAGAPGARELAAVMSASWAAFARNGSPAIPALPAWPAYRADERAVPARCLSNVLGSDPDRKALPRIAGQRRSLARHVRRQFQLGLTDD